MSSCRALLTSLWLVVLSSACGPAAPAQITIDNTTGQNETNLLGTFKLHWDVRVVLNGVDFGVIKGGTKSAATSVEANNLAFDTFEVQLNADGRGVYGVSTSDSSGPHVYFGTNDFGFPAKAAEWKKATVSVALFGDRNKTVKIGFGETVPTK